MSTGAPEMEEFVFSRNRHRYKKTLGSALAVASFFFVSHPHTPSCPTPTVLTGDLRQQSLVYLTVTTASTITMRVLSLFALAAPLVSAIQFLEPTSNSTLQKGETYSVKWDFVDTDPTTFSIYLVNFVDWPPFYTQVASDVQTTDGEYDVTVPCDVDSSWGFQL